MMSAPLRDQWTPEEIALAERLRRQGRSAGAIVHALASELGIDRSRSAVMGFMARHREAFPAHPGVAVSVAGGESTAPEKQHRVDGRTVHPGMLAARRAATEPEPVFRAPSSRVPGAAAYDAESLHLPLGALRHSQCHWPVNEPPRGGAHLFCGHETTPGRRYCAHHCQRASARLACEAA